jgi:hypothetical protein
MSLNFRYCAAANVAAPIAKTPFVFVAELKISISLPNSGLNEGSVNRKDSMNVVRYLF